MYLCILYIYIYACVCVYMCIYTYKNFETLFIVAKNPLLDK